MDQDCSGKIIQSLLVLISFIVLGRKLYIYNPFFSLSLIWKVLNPELEPVQCLWFTDLENHLGQHSELDVVLP